jgi:predicted negative regulator of RcsB-dependent stress response
MIKNYFKGFLITIFAITILIVLFYFGINFKQNKNVKQQTTNKKYQSKIKNSSQKRKHNLYNKL